jgi:uracil-DNA glycosylase
MPLDPPQLAGLRAWLASEQRFGIAHLGVTGVSLTATTAAPASTDSARAATPESRTAGSTNQSPEAPAGNEPALFGDTTAPATGRRNFVASPLKQLEPPDGLEPLNKKRLGKQAAAAALEDLNAKWVRDCVHCRLHETRTQTVFGVGNPAADLVFVGEGPGADEDRQGEPFVGRAGQLLTKMIEAMTLSRSDVYICNVVKCRPPGNRTPTDHEMARCAAFLLRQLAIIRPKIIVTLGRPAAQTLLATRTPIGKLRGTFHEFPPPELDEPNLPTCKLMPTFHPAYLLRSPGEKGKAWADLQQVMAELGLTLPKH